MPSKIIKSNGKKFYKRKGGAWSKSRKGNSFRKVGTGRGSYSRIDTDRDGDIKSTKYSRWGQKRKKLARKYPQAYDRQTKKRPYL